MRRQTPFTVEEAKAYIIESVKEWDVPSQTDKIISLAATAYNRRTKAAIVNDAAKIIDLKKNIKALELIIKRNIKMGIPSPNFEKSLETINNMYNKLVAEYKPPVKKAK